MRTRDKEISKAKEKNKARELRNSQWWKNRIAEGKCYHCGRQFHPSELTMDHLLPISRGGKSIKSNVVPCCKECNTKRKNLMPAEIILESIFGTEPAPEKD